MKNVWSQFYKVRQMLCKTNVLSQLYKVTKMFYPSSTRSENCSISALQGKQNVQSQFYKVQNLFNLSSTCTNSGFSENAIFWLRAVTYSTESLTSFPIKIEIKHMDRGFLEVFGSKKCFFRQLCNSAMSIRSESLISWISLRKQNCLHNLFSLLVRGPGGFDSGKRCQ